MSKEIVYFFGEQSITANIGGTPLALKERKDVFDVFFKFNGLRGRAHKKGTPGASPSCESSPPLRSGDSASRPQTDSGVPACRPLGRNKIECKSVQIVSSLYVAVETTKLHVVPAVSQNYKYIGIRPPLFVRAQASPPNAGAGVIHKRGPPPEVPSCAPARAGHKIRKDAIGVFSFLRDASSVPLLPIKPIHPRENRTNHKDFVQSPPDIPRGQVIDKPARRRR